MPLQREVRLRKSKDFQRVRQQRRSVMSRLLILAWSPNTVATLRVGFVVSKRVSKRAVQRNYLKRLLGEAIRPMLADLPTGWDIVISVRNQAPGIDLETLSHDLAQLLRRARLVTSSQDGEG